MEIELLQNKEDERRWSDFISGEASSTFYHQIGWKNVVERTYGHKAYYLFAQEDGQIVGILPLFFIKDMLWGRRLVSLPFAPYGGICAASGDATVKLLARVRDLMFELGARCVELRCRTDNVATNDLPKNDRYVSSLLKLPSDPDNIWQQMNQKRRNTIRKAYKYGLVPQIGEEHEGIETFYDLYAHNMRDVGTPVHSIEFFRELETEFPTGVRTVFVQHKCKVVAGMFLLLFNNTMISGWGASLRDYLCYAPNDLLYWEAIKHGCEQGFDCFDFGRSLAGSGNAKFKKEWGVQEVKLEYCYMLNRAGKIPNMNASNPKYDRLSKAWRRLPPPIADRLGPLIRKNIV